MRPRRSVVRFGFIAGLLFGCEQHNLLTGPMFQISDGAHLGGNPNFFFLPPLVPNPNHYPDFTPGGFDSTVRPTVEICALDGTGCAANQPAGFPVVFTMDAPAGSETIRLSVAEEQYIVNWHTGDADLDPALFYRIQVLASGTLLGYADVDVVSGGRELRNVNTNEFIPLLDGRTLPIKFRIERGAVATIDVSEVIAVRDQTRVLPTLVITLKEAIRVQDEPRLSRPLLIQVTEGVRVTDGAQVRPPVKVAVEERVRVADEARILSTLRIPVHESVIVNDQTRIIPPVAVTVGESVIVSDVPRVLPPLGLQVAEHLVVSDGAAALPPVAIDVVERVTVTDANDVTSQST